MTVTLPILYESVKMRWRNENTRDPVCLIDRQHVCERVQNDWIALSLRRPATKAAAVRVVQLGQYPIPIPMDVNDAWAGNGLSAIGLKIQWLTRCKSSVPRSRMRRRRTGPVASKPRVEVRCRKRTALRNVERLADAVYCIN
jgi:hypothetical protein